MRSFLLTISLSVLLASCSPVRISERKKIKKDQELVADNFKKINGTFSNKNNKPVSYDISSLWRMLFLSETKPVKNWENATVKLEVTGQSTLTATLFIGDTLLKTRTTSFRLTRGYINTKQQVKAEFLGGPVFWLLLDSKIYIGLTNENKLVLISSGQVTPILLLIPLFRAFGARNHDSFEYNRVD